MLPTLARSTSSLRGGSDPCMKYQSPRPSARSSARSLSLLGLLLLGLAPRGSADELERGARLLGELGCTNCHAASEALRARIGAVAAPNLEAIAGRASRAWMLRFLRQPHQVRPGTPMPDLLGRSEPASRDELTLALVDFLGSLGEAPGEELVRADAMELDTGRELYHTIGCVACHDPFESEESLESYLWNRPKEPAEGAEPRAQASGQSESVGLALDHLAGKTSVGALTAFLLEPGHARPSGRMPRMQLTQPEARAISLYLLQAQALDGEQGLRYEDGLAYEYYEGDFGGGQPDLDAHEVARRGFVSDLDELPEHREDGFGLRFRGFLRSEVEGLHRFELTSDDGSRLRIDGELVVDNPGEHAPKRAEGELWLSAGRHAFELEYYERGGGETLELQWQTPGAELSALPAEALSHAFLEWPSPLVPGAQQERGRIAQGRTFFQLVGCASCHTLPAAAPMRASPALAELRPEGGCLAESVPVGLPDFGLDAGQRAAIGAALRRPAALAHQNEPAAALDLQLERLACTACHVRDGHGGPDAARREHFLSRGEFDLGNEGRFPPALDHVGAKLRPDWLHAVIAEGRRIRPYLATRMPEFGEAVAATLTPLFDAVDATPAGKVEPLFTRELAEIGQRLVGTKGLGCIQCHFFAGNPSLGIPAVDLAQVYGRIQPGWFRQLLLDPKSLGMNTRMPEFLVDGISPVRDCFDGDPLRQADAIRSYLSLEDAMPLPDGLIARDSDYELVPHGRTILCSVFMKGVSPRTLLVGTPEGVHVAFDVENSRLVRSWNGRFFNAVGTWRGRAGVKEEPGGEGALVFPRGPAFTVLEEANSAWPALSGREAGLRPLGRRVDDEGNPTFRYQIGILTIEEQALPSSRPLAPGKKAALTRRFLLTAPETIDGLTFRAFEAPTIETLAPGRFRIDGRIDVELDARLGAFVACRDGHCELRLPLTLDESAPQPTGWLARALDENARLMLGFELEMSW